MLTKDKPMCHFIQVESGRYIWMTKAGDVPVNVEGYLGEKDGKHYVRVQGSKAGIPWAELKKAKVK